MPDRFKRCLRTELTGGTEKLSIQGQDLAEKQRRDSNPRKEKASKTKYFWGVRGLLWDSLNLTLTLSAMSRVDPGLGQQSDLDLTLAVPPASQVSLGGLLSFRVPVEQFIQIE